MIKNVPYILFLISFHFLISCTNKKDPSSQNIDPQQNLKILLADPVLSLDPAKIIFDSDWKVASNIFEGLTLIANNNGTVSRIVDSIKISQDLKKYLFILKKNVYFHDDPCFIGGKGRKFNAFDVEFIFIRLASRSTNFYNWSVLSQTIKGIREFTEGKTDNISGITVIDSLTISIDLVEPFSAFLRMLSSPNFYILPKESIKYYTDKGEFGPVGTGPFRVSEHKMYEKIILVRNKNYHIRDNENIQLPYLNSIEYSTIKESENRFGQLIKNKTHLIHANKVDYNRFAVDSLFQKQFETLTINKGEGIRYWGFNFNNDYNDEKFQYLRKLIQKHYGSILLENPNINNSVAYTLLPKHHFTNSLGDCLTPPKYDLQNDIKLRSFNDTIKIMANMVYPGLVEIEKILSKFHLPYKRIIKKNDYYSSISTISPTLFRVSMAPAYPDPLEYYSLFYSKSSSDINLGKYKNKDFDDIFEKIRSGDNPHLRDEGFCKLEEILNHDVAAIFISHQGPINYIYSKTLKNIKFNFTLPDFTEAYFIYDE